MCLHPTPQNETAVVRQDTQSTGIRIAKTEPFALSEVFVGVVEHRLGRVTKSQRQTDRHVVCQRVDSNEGVRRRRGGSGNTALHNACANGHVECVVALIKRGADANVPRTAASKRPTLLRQTTTTTTTRERGCAFGWL